MTCTFFGHRNTPPEAEKQLREILIDLIENKKVSEFFVGNQGDFDNMVRRELILLEEIYSIRYTVVLAYLRSDYEVTKKEIVNTIFPEGLECVPKRFAIDYRNKWMIEQSDYVVTCVKHNFGGAAKFKEYAERKKKFVINIT